MKDLVSNVFSVMQDILYGAIALLLVVIAALVVISTAGSVIEAVTGGHIMQGVIEVVDRVLLALMVAEILYTVVVSFQSHSLKPEPFLIVGLIAAVRRVLLISLEAAHMTGVQHEKFLDYMLEMSILGVLIVIFVLAILFLRKTSRSEVPG